MKGLQIIDQFKESCIQETNLDPSLLQNTDKKALGNSQTGKCFVKCLMTKSGIIDAQGNVQLEAIQTSLNVDMNSAFMQKMSGCANIQMDDPCEKAYAIHECGVML